MASFIARTLRTTDSSVPYGEREYGSSRSRYEPRLLQTSKLPPIVATVAASGFLGLTRSRCFVADGVTVNSAYSTDGGATWSSLPGSFSRLDPAPDLAGAPGARHQLYAREHRPGCTTVSFGVRVGRRGWRGNHRCQQRKAAYTRTTDNDAVSQTLCRAVTGRDRIASGARSDSESGPSSVQGLDSASSDAATGSASLVVSTLRQPERRSHALNGRDLGSGTRPEADQDALVCAWGSRLASTVALQRYSEAENQLPHEPRTWRSRHSISLSVLSDLCTVAPEGTPTCWHVTDLPVPDCVVVAACPGVFRRLTTDVTQLAVSAEITDSRDSETPARRWSQNLVTS